ncbi:MAG: hypothetical protein CME32_11575 [Gimesia sp.]|nr:hypothetical protein [Gimesia sp.]
MADVPQIPLKEFFKLFAPTYVLGTTYTVSLAFFEGLIYPEIKRTHLRRCLILCDKIGFQRATVETSALRAAGQEYIAACAPTRHSFHPKVWLMIGEGKVALLVGSGNLTQSGFMDNTELFDLVLFEENGAHKTVAKDLITFINGLRSIWSGVETQRLLAVETLEEIRREIELLADRMPHEADPKLRFLSNFSSPLVHQLRDSFVGGRLYLAAPYFGGSTEGVKLLQNELHPNSTHIFPAIHNGKNLDVSITELESLPNVSVDSLKMARKDSFAHLKVYGFDSRVGQWIFTTSANCTLAALNGKNVEAGLLRRTDSQTLSEYFAKQPTRILPDVVRESDFEDGDPWFSFWAVDRGNRLELIVSNSDDIPLRNISVIIKIGGISESQQFDTLFNKGSIENINWDLFSSVTDRTKQTALISIRATDNKEREVFGDAIIDNPLLLTSDPTHRSAWRAALTLLENEGLPESSDLANIFHLVQDVFDADDEPTRNESEKSSTKKSQGKMSIPDKVPIWPPVAEQEWPGGAIGSSQLHNLKWFQKILTEFLNPRRGSDDDTSTADGMDDELVAEVKQVRVPAHVVKSIWKQASKSLEQLQTRLTQLIVTKTTARKIWPVATAVFVATLLTRRQLLRHLDSNVLIPSTHKLIREFLSLLFVDRVQPLSFVLPESCRYRHSIFPSLAEDLKHTFGETPSPDIAGILCLLFALWSFEESQNQKSIPANAWLLFREIAPQVADGSQLDKQSLQTIFEKYIISESDGISWSNIDKELSTLIITGWAEHEGYRQLDIMMRRGREQRECNDFPEHLEDRWIQTQRRIQHNQKWFFPVESLSDLCAADDCSVKYVSDPKKRKDLRRLAPTICSSCGAILIPERLWHAYEENHG